MMNNKLFLISLLISSSVQIFGQDVVPRQAPIDNMSSIEDSMKDCFKLLQVTETQLETRCFQN